MSARQCLKRLYLEVNEPDLAARSSATEAAFRIGHAVGAIAQRLYADDNAVVIPFDGGMDHALRKTARLVHDKVRYPIFEATFQYGGVLVRIDALLPDGDAWRIVEVKASTSVKEEHEFDCAAQRWVFEGLGHRLGSIALAHVDNTFVYDGQGDFAGLLTEVDQTDSTGKLLPLVPGWIDSARDALADGEPGIPVGAQCFSPYECPFIRYCWPSDTDYPVQGLGGKKARLGEFVTEGYRDVRDVPESQLDDRQRWIQAVTRSGKAQKLPGAREFVAALDYPRYYLDFETIMPAIPVWPGTRPYETLPIQWSCHYEAEPGELEHSDFLDLSGRPPMRILAESLIRALGKSGPVLVYTSYESRVLTGLMERYPDLERPLAAIARRLVDLHRPTHEFYYHPAMAGSWSLKAVLPTIGVNMDYKKLEGIQEGTEASEGYLEAIGPDTPAERKAELERQLRAYCRFDTAAMVRLVGFLGS